MSTQPTTSAPTFAADRTVDELLLPVTADALNEESVPFAATLATAWGLPIRVIHVSGSISSQDEELERIADGLRAAHPGITVIAEHVYGDDPAIAIAGQMRPQSLPIVATEHMDKWRFKESVAEALVGHGGVPMLLLGPNVTSADAGHHALDGDIVVGLDGSLPAESALEPALGLARSTGRPVWLVTVVPEPEPGDEDHLTRPTEYLEALAEYHRSDVGIHWQVIEGNDPVPTLEAFAEQKKAGFLVASTGGRFNPSRHSMASITSGLVSASSRPVLVLKAPSA